MAYKMCSQLNKDGGCEGVDNDDVDDDDDDSLEERFLELYSLELECSLKDEEDEAPLDEECSSKDKECSLEKEDEGGIDE
jgi:hypothetical protein